MMAVLQAAAAGEGSYAAHHVEKLAAALARLHAAGVPEAAAPPIQDPVAPQPEDPSTGPAPVTADGAKK